jgi:hypothetical protein
MAYQVNDETKKQTTKCRYGFECLGNDDWNTCTIKQDLHSSGLIIKDKCDKVHCAYSMQFGSSMYLCSCPARREIYQRYKV